MSKSIEEELAEIKLLLVDMANRQTQREWYSTEQVAQILGRSEFSVREWLRLGRAHGVKARSGRGAHAGWRISHAELLRLQREGLLPLPERN